MQRRAVVLALTSVAAVVAVGVLVSRPRAATSARPAVAGCDGFDFPVGPPDAAGYYDAQPFGERAHLGSDWNGVAGGDSDLGEPVHSVAAGVVVFAEDVGGGWGNVVRVVHRCHGAEAESLYAHLDAIDVHAGDPVGRGARVGTIGTAGGQYPAHLHFELRATIGRPIGGGYGAPDADQVDPTAFIRAHRPVLRACEGITGSE